MSMNILPAYMSAHHFLCQVPAAAVEGMGFCGTRVTGVMSIQWVVGIKPKSSGRAASEVISLASWIDAQFSQNI